jgi:predicted RNA-binding Zn-ribbon protein involved in translation (DUF1610 family)
MFTIVCTSCGKVVPLDDTKLPMKEVVFPCPACNSKLSVDVRLVMVAGPRLVLCRCCGAQVSNQAATCPRCGQPDPGVHDWIGKAKAAVSQRKMIDAIKIVRQYSGLDLKEAKELIESWSKES